MSDDLFRDPFVLKVIRATLVSKGIPDERLDEAVDKVVRACVERVRRTGRPPADVGQATAIALTIANAAGRARPRPEGGASTPPPKEPATESSPPPAPVPAASEKRPEKAPRATTRRRAPVAWIAAGLAMVLAGLTVVYLRSARERGEPEPARGATQSADAYATASPEGDGGAEATPHEALDADIVDEAAAQGGGEGTDAAQPEAASVPDAARDAAP
jgi:hypothetical protein